jgi:hypothetical protein
MLHILQNPSGLLLITTLPLAVNGLLLTTVERERVCGSSRGSNKGFHRSKQSSFDDDDDAFRIDRLRLFPVVSSCFQLP